MRGKEREKNVHWILTCETKNLQPEKDRQHLQALKRMKDSFDRLVDARKNTVRTLMKVAKDVKGLDDKMKVGKISNRGVSVIGKSCHFTINVTMTSEIMMSESISIFKHKYV
jgi:hypothetical protein